MRSDGLDILAGGTVVDAIVWRRLDVPGLDAAWLIRDGLSWRLVGQVVFREQSTPYALSYAVTCDQAWRTTAGEVRGRVGDRAFALSIIVDSQRQWLVDGVARPALAGCVDLDLGFTPATNTLSIRRLMLEVGGAAEVTTAWLDFPNAGVQPLPQVYRRTGERVYDYAAPTHGFTSTLQVNEHGLITRYPPLWEAVVGE